MFENHKNDINTKIETNKIGLETFALDRHNKLDRPIDILIQDLKNDIKKEYAEHNKLSDIKQNNPERFDELEEIAQQTGHSIHFQIEDYLRTISFIEEELMTLYGMKIIYAFKHLEVEIKNLISASYNEKSISKSSKWDNLIQFLKSKNIEINEIKEYCEVNQLRTVNNSLKHSNEQIDNSLKGIDEWKNIKFVHYEILEKFYSRIKDSPNTFLTYLSFAIHKNLYGFDDEKLERISNSIALRMDKENAENLIEKIRNKYK